MTDGSIVASVLLVDYLLTDIRPGRDGKLNRLIERTPIPYGSQESLTGRSMIDLTFQKKDLDTFGGFTSQMIQLWCFKTFEFQSI